MKIAADSVVQILQSNQALSLAEVGRQVNVSRERIRQITDGIPGASRHRQKRYCSSCGIEIFYQSSQYHWAQGFCPTCWLVETARKKKAHWDAHHIKFTCEICGCEFYRTKAKITFLARTQIHTTRFCSKFCQGKNLGRGN